MCSIFPPVQYFRKTGPGCKPWNQGRCCRIHRNIHWGTFTHRRSYYSAPSSGGSSSGGSSGYRVGSTYTLRANMNVRTGPGTNYVKKKRSALTANARAHCTSSSSAVLKSGTRVTCKAVRTVGSDIWLQIPSGYVCARTSGKVYIS